MKKCPFCHEMSEDKIDVCNCGYNYNKEEITDSSKIIGWLNTPEPNEHWSNKIERLKKIDDFQMEYYNPVKLANDPHLGWSFRKLAKLLNKKNSSHLSKETRLVEAFSKYPELKNYKNKTNALNKLKELEGKSSLEGEESVVEYEDELQNYLERNWEIIPFANEWTLCKKGKYNISEIGEIDLLAKNKEGNNWLVIELKKDQASDATVGQILRYMGFIKRELLDSKDEVVMGLIIARDFDKKILYALSCCPEIRIKEYSYSNDGIEFVDIDKDLKISLIDFKKRTHNEQKDFIEELQKLKTELE